MCGNYQMLIAGKNCLYLYNGIGSIKYRWTLCLDQRRRPSRHCKRYYWIHHQNTRIHCNFLLQFSVHFFRQVQLYTVLDLWLRNVMIDNADALFVHFFGTSVCSPNVCRQNTVEQYVHETFTVPGHASITWVLGHHRIFDVDLWSTVTFL